MRAIIRSAMLALAVLSMGGQRVAAQVDPAARGLAIQAKLAVRGIAAPTVLNNSAANLRKWTAARSRALAAGGLATINLVGDSTQGYKGSGTGASLAIGGQPKSMAASLVKLLNGWAGRADFARSDGFFGGHSSLFATDLAEFATYDPRWSLANLQAGTSARLGGVNLRIPAASTTPFTYQASLPYDRVRIVYARYSTNTTTIAVSSASGGSGTVTASAISGGGATGGDLQSTTINVTRGAGLLTFTPSGGSTATDIVVVELWDSTVGQVIVRDIAAAGSQASQWVTQAPLALAQVPADFTNYCFTLNESAAGVQPDAFEASLRSLMALGSPGSISLTVENESSTGGFGGLPLQRSLADRIRTLGAALGVPVIDVPARWGDYVAANDNARMADTGHPNGAGYADKAVAMLSIATQ